MSQHIHTKFTGNPIINNKTSILQCRHSKYLANRICASLADHTECIPPTWHWLRLWRKQFPRITGINDPTVTAHYTSSLHAVSCLCMYGYLCSVEDAKVSRQHGMQLSVRRKGLQNESRSDWAAPIVLR